MSSINKKIEIIFEIKINGFSISITHTLITINPITIANIWDRTTMDSIGLIAKNKLANDQRNKQKNNIVVLW